MLPADGLISFIVLLLPLVFIQRLLHRELQLILFSITRNPRLALGLFSLIFLPGIVTHELSHLVMAKLLGVRTGNFSVTPHALPDGRLQLGYLETGRADPLRDSLIGLAPLFTGGLVVAYVGVTHLDLLPLWNEFRSGDLQAFWHSLQVLPQLKDFPIWFYLTFTVSSTMLPSTSDRHSFLPLALYSGLLIGLALLVGAGSFFKVLMPILNIFLNSVATVFGLSVLVHALLVLPIIALHALLSRVPA